jgi:hypothetical protein
MTPLQHLDDRAILAARGPRNTVDPTKPNAYFVEPEPTPDGVLEDVATLLTTNAECPFRCLMCDLWRNTTPEPLEPSNVARQVAWALDELPFTPHVKIYNAGNFFDNHAMPAVDRSRIAELMKQRSTLVVECHPKLIDQRCVDYARSLAPVKLQVAMGLETVDPDVVPRLNKRMTLDDYARATELLLEHGVNVRAFILVRTPFQSETEGADWAMRSIDYAFSIGVECCVVIPTRVGNGIMEQLEQQGSFHPPSIRSVERVLEYGLRLGRGRVFADLWDIERFYDCPACGSSRAERLKQMNLTQTYFETVVCSCERTP